ncbi:MAG TPA: NUDIX hydrolase [Candidatus Thermoplasmatota archaeon]|nr:NUDIX hydrolase [Candidatus Thermoplasmatota archaeon]
MPHEVRNAHGYVSPALTVDAVLLKGHEVMLIRRARDPFKGSWALPGGFVEVGERVEDAARRELLEETGLRGDIVDLLGVWSDAKRDPRGHTVSVVFVCKIGGIVIGIDDDRARHAGRAGIVDPRAGDDAAEAKWFALDKLPALAFDHADILAAARAWLTMPGHFEKLGDTDLGRCA